MVQRPKWVPLETWAAARYDPLPSIHTLRRWCREKRIHPAADLVGKEYRVLENAEKVGAPKPYISLVGRLGGRDDY